MNSIDGCQLNPPQVNVVISISKQAPRFLSICLHFQCNYLPTVDVTLCHVFPLGASNHGVSLFMRSPCCTIARSQNKDVFITYLRTKEGHLVTIPLAWSLELRGGRQEFPHSGILLNKNRIQNRYSLS